MALTWWWLALLAAAGLAAAVVHALRSPTRRPSRLPAAHTDVLQRSPRYRALARAEAQAAVIAVVGTLLLATGGLFLTGRLAESSTVSDDRESRDIMLCLDVSSSMTEADAEVVDAYRGIIDRLRGDRVGLMLWSGATVPAFPLTDDYAFISDELDRATRAFEEHDYDYIAGTVLLQRRASSQIGDGLVSCLKRFDRPDEKRTRVVVLASDNDIQGPPVFTLEQGIDLAQRRGVVVHCIAPEEGDADLLSAFGAACRRTGGTLALLGGDRGADEIVTGIDRLARTTTKQPPRVLVRDRPTTGAVLGGLGLALLALAPIRRRWVR